jgi:hypothetical protein
MGLTINDLALSHAIGRTLTPKTALEPGNYPIRGTVTLTVDCIVTKAEETFSRMQLGKEDLLALAFRLAGIADQQAREPIDATLSEASRIAAKEMPAVRREGATRVSGSVQIAAFAQA